MILALPWSYLEMLKFHILSQVLCHLCHRQLQSLYHSIHSFSLYVACCHIYAILQYHNVQHSTSRPPKWSIAQHSAFNHHRLIILFCKRINLQNVWRCGNRRTQSPLQGSLTVELDIIKKSCLKIGLLIQFYRLNGIVNL